MCQEYYHNIKRWLQGFQEACFFWGGLPPPPKLNTPPQILPSKVPLFNADTELQQSAPPNVPNPPPPRQKERSENLQEARGYL